MQVYCDFDGTISTVDTTDHILEALAAPSWLTLEDDWLAGRISAADCMRAQVALIGGDDAALNAALDAVGLDEGFVDFVGWCEKNDIPLSVVSDGVDYFIRRILDRHGLPRVPVISNRLAGRAGARRLEQPFRRAGCAAGSGVCKCQVVKPSKTSRQTVVYVGDGRSDFCVSARADILFAKGALADYAASLNRAHHTYDTFHDVTATLDGLVLDARMAAI